MKKLLLLFAALCCMMLANAQQFTDASGIKYYVTSESTVEVVENGYSGDIVIPATVEYNDVMYRVTSISSYAFQTCRGLTSITLPSSVTSIGENAFWYCESLTSITIPSSVTAIGTRVIGKCVNLSSIRVDEGSTVYDSRDNCNAIIEKATNTLVAGCKNTVVPSTVTAIGEFAFYGLTNLTSITIPNSVTSIGESAFSDCTSLPSVSLPNSVTSIGENAFSACTSLSSVSLPSSLPSIGKSAFTNCTSLSSVSLPSGLTSIGEKAFTNCTSLSSVSLPSGLTSIGKRAFSSCSSLSSIAVFAPNPPALGTDAFRNIPLAATVRVPNGKIDSYRSAWGSHFRFAELTTDDYRQQALCEINGAMQGVELTDEEQTAINDYIQTITNAEDITAIENAKEAALAIIRLKLAKAEAIAAINGAMQGVELTDEEQTAINDYIQTITNAEDITAIENAKEAALAIIRLKLAKAEAIAAIEAAMQGETSAYLTGLVQQYVSIINAATDVTAINNARDTALTVLNAAVPIYKTIKAEALGEMGTECEGCPAIRVTKGEKEIILYAPEKVEIIKIPANTDN